MKSEFSNQRDNVVEDWPSDGLERVETCPVCGSAQRKQLYSWLTDRVFHCAPGYWDLYQCEGCHSAYLDPRPSKESIHLAYRHYYTHERPQRQNTENLPIWRRWLRSISDDYRIKQYKAINRAGRAGSILGYWLVSCLPPLKTPIDRKYRYLPRASEDCFRLLDVGFGSGEFMDLARQMGYKSVGVDQDSVSVRNALKAGLDVKRGGIETFEDCIEKFDVITINHVLEHLHDPVETINAAYRLLRPGGMLYIETPNIEAYGHNVFREHWRGLEIPRHLVLFNWKSMVDSLKKAGFVNFEKIQKFSPYSGMSSVSRALRNNEDPCVYGSVYYRDVLIEVLFGTSRFFFGSKTEFITIRAWKQLRTR